MKIYIVVEYNMDGMSGVLAAFKKPRVAKNWADELNAKHPGYSRFFEVKTIDLKETT